eukprot:2282643-Rhodomonas_salina.1
MGGRNRACACESARAGRKGGKERERTSRQPGCRQPRKTPPARSQEAKPVADTNTQDGDDLLIWTLRVWSECEEEDATGRCVDRED